MEIHFDVWFDDDGKAFGEECVQILEAVEKTGSLNKAAADVNLSYCCAFKILKEGEKKLGFTLLDRQIGGSSGGGSSLTPEARMFLAKYREFVGELSETIDDIFKKHFDSD